MYQNTGIKSFYDDKVIFITGGSGFVGKVLIEKLLRSCPGVKKIYILLREKKERSAEERMKGLFNIELFKILRSRYPNFEEKVQAIAGDLMLDRLGISDEDRSLLQKSVDIVIHSAATVRFDEQLRTAVQMNVIAVREMVKLCRSMEKLKMFCHVSTAYSNCDKSAIAEKLYPVSTDPQKLIDSLDWMSDEIVDAMTPNLLGNYPNTYTFTKGLAEHIVTNEGGDMPIVIVRPSIIIGSYAEPFPGWIDNYNGPSGLIVAAGKGMLRTMKYSSDAVADVVPVDFVANAIITAVWYSTNNRGPEPLIYNCTSGNVNPLTWKYLGIYGQLTLKKYPFEEIFRRPNFSFESNRLAYFYWRYVSHRIPAVIADTMSILIGSKPRVWRFYDRMEKAVKTLEFFTIKGWSWTGDNFLALSDAIPEEEKKIFNFDMTTIQWDEYIEIFVLGIKQYLMKDRLENLAKARWQVTRYRLVRWISCTLFFIVTCRVLFIRSLKFRQLWFRVVFAAYRALRSLNLVSVAR
ncbi:fatty acyl-CoA reductase 1-like [Rhopilema esculentum]|uniref:fatty acyl-CoA reductase 1-like n=1 Tax=Rhopilema esculentum TaxID=499914 RepID=UPI0031D925C5|eukprot:gene11651-21897_t